MSTTLVYCSKVPKWRTDTMSHILNIDFQGDLVSTPLKFVSKPQWLLGFSSSSSYIYTFRVIVSTLKFLSRLHYHNDALTRCAINTFRVILSRHSSSYLNLNDINTFRVILSWHSSSYFNFNTIMTHWHDEPYRLSGWSCLDATQVRI